MREGRLIVALNTRKRDNFGFFDPLTCTNLSISHQYSEDLNRPLVDANTLKEVQMDLSNIRHALKCNNLIVVEGELDGHNAQVMAPPVNQFNPTHEQMMKWQGLVQSKVIANSKKK